MRKIFDLNNPVWKFIGNIADFFVLSMLWYLSVALILPFGAGSSALFDVTLSMADNTEGYIVRSFFRAFKSCFKKATLIWMIFLCFGLVLGADIYWIFYGNPRIGIYFLPGAVALGVVYIIAMAFVFPYISRSAKGVKEALLFGISLALKNFIPVFSYTLLFAGIMLLGIFVFKPVLLIAPGICAYIASFILNRIFAKYDIVSDSFRNVNETPDENS